MLVEDTFFEVFTEPLIDAGELETADRVYYASTRGIRIDGYGGDPLSADGVLSLIISDFSQSPSIRHADSHRNDAAFRRLSNFVERSLREEFRNCARRVLARLRARRPDSEAVGSRPTESG